MAAKPQQRDMKGQTVLVTGEPAGSATRPPGPWPAAGPQVITTGRDATRGQDAAAAIRRESGADSAAFLQADHSTAGGNRQLACQVHAAYPGLNILINNVGGLHETRWETADGYEPTWR